MGERYRANALADEVNWEGHPEEGPHGAGMESGLLKSDGETDGLVFFPPRKRIKHFNCTIQQTMTEPFQQSSSTQRTNVSIELTVTSFLFGPHSIRGFNGIFSTGTFGKKKR